MLAVHYAPLHSSTLIILWPVSLSRKKKKLLAPSDLFFRARLQAISAHQLEVEVDRFRFTFTVIFF